MNTLALISRYDWRILALLPTLITMINETTEAVEAIGGAGTGEAKKQAVLEAVDAAYDATKVLDLNAIELDKLAFRQLASLLIDSVVGLKNNVAQLRGGRDADELAAF